MPIRLAQETVHLIFTEKFRKLLCEVIRVRGDSVDLQIFEETRGLRVGDAVDFQEQNGEKADSFENDVIHW